jgi:hypothetical protein
MMIGSGTGGYVIFLTTSIYMVTRKVPLRLAALLLGRLDMDPADAIKAYRTLDAVITSIPSKNEEERRNNMAKFSRAFTDILHGCGLNEKTPLMTEESHSKT